MSLKKWWHALLFFTIVAGIALIALVAWMFARHERPAAPVPPSPIPAAPTKVDTLTIEEKAEASKEPPLEETLEPSPVTILGSELELPEGFDIFKLQSANRQFQVYQIEGLLGKSGTYDPLFEYSWYRGEFLEWNFPFARLVAVNIEEHESALVTPGQYRGLIAALDEAGLFPESDSLTTADKVVAKLYRSPDIYSGPLIEVSYRGQVLWSGETLPPRPLDPLEEWTFELIGDEFGYEVANVDRVVDIFDRWYDDFDTSIIPPESYQARGYYLWRFPVSPPNLYARYKAAQELARRENVFLVLYPGYNFWNTGRVIGIRFVDHQCGNVLEEFGLSEGWEQVFYKPNSGWLRVEISEQFNYESGEYENFKPYVIANVSGAIEINVISVDMADNDEPIITFRDINGSFRAPFLENMELAFQLTRSILLTDDYPGLTLLEYLPEP